MRKIRWVWLFDILYCTLQKGCDIIHRLFFYPDFFYFDRYTYVRITYAIFNNGRRNASIFHFFFLFYPLFYHPQCALPLNVFCTFLDVSVRWHGMNFPKNLFVQRHLKSLHRYPHLHATHSSEIFKNKKNPLFLDIFWKILVTSFQSHTILGMGATDSRMVNWSFLHFG